MRKKKTLVSLNLCNSGSTGGIMRSVSARARKRGYNTYQVYPGGDINLPAEENDIIICSEIEKKIYQRICRYIGLNGCSAFFATLRLLRKLHMLRPDIIQFHNLHHSYVNLPLLFHYIKRNNISTVWTLHDCWAFTGHCPHFTYIRCEKWKVCCHGCPQYKAYPESAFDDSKRMYRLKHKWFCGVEKMVFVTPSVWLADLVKQSFLQEYPVRVINNGIDLSVFTPRENDFRERYGVSAQKYMVLGVAFGWDDKKGLDVMVKLAKTLPETYQIVIVGSDHTVDKKLPDNIISIHRTNNREELAQIYSAADLLVNPTREDTYPTVNMEAIACGTPVLTFRTGGSPEILSEKSGVVVPYNDFDAMYQEVIRICENRPFSRQDCVEHAKQFDMNRHFDAYVDLYEQLTSKNVGCQNDNEE